jgi:hypothetical protein
MRLTFHDEILAHIGDEELLGRKGVVASHLFLDEGSKDARIPKK